MLSFDVLLQVLESAVQDLGDQDSTTRYPDDMFEDVENLSDSDLDIDTISIHSTPKPKLRLVVMRKIYFDLMTSNLANVLRNSSKKFYVEKRKKYILSAIKIYKNRLKVWYKHTKLL